MVAVGVDPVVDTVYALGTFTSGATDDVWLGAYDSSSGALLWTTVLDPTAGGVLDINETAFGLGVHPSGDPIIFFERDDPSAPYGLMRVDPIAITVSWAVTMGLTDIAPNTIGLSSPSMAVSPGGSIFMSGRSIYMGAGELGFADTALWVARFADVDGASMWLTELPIINGETVWQVPRVLAADEATGVFMGQESTGVGPFSSTLYRFSFAGALEQVVSTYVGFSQPPVFRDLAQDAAGNLVFTYTDVGFPATEVFVERRNAMLAQQSVGVDSEPPIEIPHAIAVDPAGTALVVGRQDDVNAWARAFDPAGGLLWYLSWAEPGNNQFLDVATQPDTSWVVSGFLGAEGLLRKYGACE